jgi:hypothetical protein
MATRVTSPEDARRLVLKIADDHGQLPEDIFEEMTERARHHVLRSMNKKDKRIGSAVVT